MRVLNIFMNNMTPIVCQKFTHWPLMGIDSTYNIEGELYSCAWVGVGADIV